MVCRVDFISFLVWGKYKKKIRILTNIMEKFANGFAIFKKYNHTESGYGYSCNHVTAGFFKFLVKYI